MSGYRLENCHNGIYRMWAPGDTRPCGVITSGFGSWTARPLNRPGADAWAWTAPTRRQALTQLCDWLAA